MQEYKFAFGEVVKVSMDAEQAFLRGEEGYIDGRCVGNDGAGYYAVMMRIDQLGHMFREEELVSCGRFIERLKEPRQTIHVRVDPETDEGSIVEVD